MASRPLRDPGQTQIEGKGLPLLSTLASQKHTARLPASSGRPAGAGRGQARAHLAVALPADLLAAAVGARANGVQHLVVLHPSRHGGARAGRLQAVPSSRRCSHRPTNLQPRCPAALIRRFNRRGPRPRSLLARGKAASPL